MPAGYVHDSNGTQYIVQVGDEIKAIDDLTNMVLMDMKLDGIAPIHVGDVADVEDVYKRQTKCMVGLLDFFDFCTVQKILHDCFLLNICLLYTSRCV